MLRHQTAVGVTIFSIYILTPSLPRFPVPGRHYRNCCTNMAVIRKPHSIKRRMHTAVVDLRAIVFVKCNLIRAYTPEKYFPWSHLRKCSSRLILLIYLAAISTNPSLRRRWFKRPVLQVAIAISSSLYSFVSVPIQMSSCCSSLNFGSIE